MNSHSYLRAYMAGVVVPTVVLVIILSAFIIARFVCGLPIPIERAMIFPMGLVPSLFGLWNMIYLRWHYLPIGFHGALLPFLLAPSGFLLARGLDILAVNSEGLRYFQAITVPYAYLASGFAVGVIVYYLIWKYLVGFFNQVLGIA